MEFPLGVGEGGLGLSYLQETLCYGSWTVPVGLWPLRQAKGDTRSALRGQPEARGKSQQIRGLLGGAEISRGCLKPAHQEVCDFIRSLNSFRRDGMDHLIDAAHP